MRVLIAVLFAAVQLSAQSDQPAVFRSGVEVMEVDVTVVDGKGTPVGDLRAPDFSVTIDGQPRRVNSAEFISAASSSPKPAVRDPYVSNNTDRRPGRLIMLAIDRNNTETQALRQSVAPLRNFVMSLSPDDRLGLVSIPPPGPSVEFTTNHALVIDALSRVIGMDDSVPGQFNLSHYEALAFQERSNPVVIQRLLSRACGDSDPANMSDCDRDVEQEAIALASHIRQQTSQSVSGFAALLRNLRDVEGAKSLIILSQGLMLEGTHSEATALAQMAAEARVSVNVLMYDASGASAAQARASSTASQDRDLREGGLETLASRSRGALFRVVANPQYVFDRLRDEISSHYMLGVEPLEKDRDGKPHQIRVQVGRTGLQVRSRRQVQYATRTPNTWSRDVLMGRVLRSPAPNTELPMRLSSYVYRDAAPGKVKVVLAAEIDPAKMENGLDIAIGFAIFDRQGAVVASGQERKVYSANSDLPIRYDLTIPLDPGTYRVRLAAIDLAGSSGSVERDVDAFRMDQQLAVGDLILTHVPDGKVGEVRPPVVLQVKDGRLGAFTELYTTAPGFLEKTGVVFEVADTVDGPTLQSAIAEIRERPDGTMRQAVAVIPVGALPPGRYIARAIIASSGTTAAKLARPFEVLPPSTARKASTSAPSATVDKPTSAPSATMGRPDLVAARPGPFKREDVLTSEMLRAVFDVMDQHHPAAKAAVARARSGKLEGTALMALDAGDQFAGSILRGLEYLSKGQLDPAGKQFGVAMRNAADGPVASFYLGACFAAVGNDREALAAWERATAAQLRLPGMDVVVADGWLRLGRPAEALEPLQQALTRQPQSDHIRRNLAIAQSQLGLHEQAYPTIVPFLDRHPSDPDALLVALFALYQVRLEGKTIGSADQHRAKAAAYARAYADAKGPHAALVEKWAEFLSR